MRRAVGNGWFQRFIRRPFENIRWFAFECYHGFLRFFGLDDFLAARILVNAFIVHQRHDPAACVPVDEILDASLDREGDQLIGEVLHEMREEIEHFVLASLRFEIIRGCENHRPFAILIASDQRKRPVRAGGADKHLGACGGELRELERFVFGN